ncbi:hypothetical protein H0H81_007632 [Sphagnurus paluster]|uniref:Uncharacterized protein n=1 Tax=Sphagnurus paluster TaxID=117069 RepID=A0A9P7K546_9AGAR|nr:hypothetical protein H0H81_007632 [Sphagnurus paluster]
MLIILNELGVPFSTVFCSVFANRLIIGVRLAHYGDAFASTPDFSLEFHHTDAAQEVQSDVVEFSTFNEHIGT